MEVSVDQDLCISCGLCINSCPGVFDWNHDNKADAVASPVPDESEECCREAIDSCPTQAITVA